MSTDCGLSCPQCGGHKIVAGWKGPEIDDKETETFYGGSVALFCDHDLHMVCDHDLHAEYTFVSDVVTYTCECGCRFAIEGS
jgi:hypothetical protein